MPLPFLHKLFYNEWQEGHGMSLKSEKAWKKWSEAAAQCPVCGLALESGEGGLTCKSGHHFDLSRQGSVPVSYTHLTLPTTSRV